MLPTNIFSIPFHIPKKTFEQIKRTFYTFKRAIFSFIFSQQPHTSQPARTNHLSLYCFTPLENLLYFFFIFEKKCSLILRIWQRLADSVSIDSVFYRQRNLCELKMYRIDDNKEEKKNYKRMNAQRWRKKNQYFSVIFIYSVLFCR